MRRVLVPLDGSSLSASVLPDAVRLAGPGGHVRLLRDFPILAYPDAHWTLDDEIAFQDAIAHLDAQATALAAQGVQVDTRVGARGNPAAAIGAAAREFDAQLIACATHGRDPIHRLPRGSVAWTMLSQSHVPVLVRHATSGVEANIEPEGSPRRIMVPLDGSSLAEQALPLAARLSAEWDAPIWLIQVVVTLKDYRSDRHRVRIPLTYSSEVHQEQAYLERLAADLPGTVHASVLRGDVLNCLTAAVDNLSITDVVMATHGRTGVARLLLGSVADALIRRLRCPIVVVPARVAERSVELARPREVVEAAPVR